MRPTEKLAAIIALVVFIISGIFLYKTSIHAYGTEMAVRGGEIREGIIGYPRFINPVLAISDADKDLTGLIYSGLLKPSPNGNLIPDLAESWNISTDGLIHTFRLKPNVTFHDGASITTDDIEFTLQKIVDPAIKSPRAANFAGVTIEKVSPSEIKFILKKPYAPFAENLTLGILPKHIWESIDTENFDISTYNRVEPVGSGPYQIKKASQSDSGLYDNFTLVPFKKYALGEPKIASLKLSFYRNEGEAVNAMKSGAIDTLGGLSSESITEIKEADGNIKELETYLPRIFAVFFNQNTAPILLKKEVRKALDIGLDRNELIKVALAGHGSPIYSPLPEVGLKGGQLRSLGTTTGSSTSSDKPLSDAMAPIDIDAGQIAEAKKLLETNGWTLDTEGIYEKKATAKDPAIRFAFTISTSNSPELKATAEELRRQWREIGADITVEIFESTDLTQKVIRPRKYAALLFGQVIGRDMDLYPFWHSSQRNDPGLNISLYANSKADKAIELARSTTDATKKLVAETDFKKEIQTDIPAIFIFSPNYAYMESKDIKGQQLKNINEPSERFMDIHSWYLKTKYKWNFLIKDTDKQ